MMFVLKFNLSKQTLNSINTRRIINFNRNTYIITICQQVYFMSLTKISIYKNISKITIKIIDIFCKPLFVY